MSSARRPVINACADASAFATSSVCWLARRMGGGDRHDELDRCFARTLVQPLEERVLAVAPDLAP
jgi:hypothetical protein